MGRLFGAAWNDETTNFIQDTVWSVHFSFIIHFFLYFDQSISEYGDQLLLSYTISIRENVGDSGYMRKYCIKTCSTEQQLYNWTQNKAVEPRRNALFCWLFLDTGQWMDVRWRASHLTKCSRHSWILFLFNRGRRDTGGAKSSTLTRKHIHCIHNRCTQYKTSWYVEQTSKYQCVGGWINVCLDWKEMDARSYTCTTWWCTRRFVRS